MLGTQNSYRFSGGLHPYPSVVEWAFGKGYLSVQGAHLRQRPYAIGRIAQVRKEPASTIEITGENEEEAGEKRRMRLEAVLLMAKTSLTTRKLAQLAHLADGTEARTLVRQLNRCYDKQGRALRVEQVAGGYRLLTRPAFAPWLTRLGHLPPVIRLSSPMMETLAVVAYRQPVSRALVEAVRGVACGELLRQLLEKDLIRIAGRSEELGRPYLYGTTKRFLQLFGLATIEELPAIRKESFQLMINARESDELIDSTPNDTATSMKESVVSTSLTSVPSETDSSTVDEIQSPHNVAVLDPMFPRASDEDEDEEFDDDDEDDDDEEDDDLDDEEEDFEDDWDDEDGDLDDEDEDEIDEDWEEVDDEELDDDDEDLEEDEDEDEDDEDEDWDDEDEDEEEDEDWD